LIEKSTFTMVIILVIVVTGLLSAFYISGYLSIRELLSNILSELLGIGIGILIVNVMLSEMENRAWKKVKSHVYDDIRLTAEWAYTSIINIFGQRMFAVPPEIKDKTEFDKFIEMKQYQSIKNLASMSGDDLKKELRKRLGGPGFEALVKLHARGLIRCAEEFSYIEQTYLKFLTPKLADILMQLRRSLRDLGRGIESYLAVRDRFHQKIMEKEPTEREYTRMGLELSMRLEAIATSFKQVIPLLLEIREIEEIR